jgi:soluble lytic murein transglycosylase-like protein
MEASSDLKKQQELFMLHRKYRSWLGAALCVWQIHAAANLDEQPSVLSEQPDNLLENDVKPIDQAVVVPKKTSPSNQKMLEKLADKAAVKYGLNTHLFRALVTHESRWNPEAVSSQNAIGLTQIQAPTAEEFCDLEANDLFDPEKNLDCGAKYFSIQLKTFGTVELALCAYNAGPNRVKRLGNKCPADYSVTQKYIRTVKETWRETLWSNVWVLDKWGYHLEDIFDFS